MPGVGRSTRVAVGSDEAGRERRRTRHDVQHRHLDALAVEPVPHKRARRVVTDPAGKRDRDAEPGEGDRRRRRGSATREHAIGRRQALVRLRQARHGDDRIERGMAHADDGGAAGGIGHGRTLGRRRGSSLGCPIRCACARWPSWGTLIP